MKFELTTTYLKYQLDEYVVPFGIRLLVALTVLFIGKMVSKMIVRGVDRLVEGRLEDSLRKFLSSMLYGLLLAVVVIAALERLGVQTTAAVAILGAAGLAVGFALQGSLGNFASGVMIIIFHPYKVNDMISVAGHIGKVDAIEIFNTVLKTPDNRRIIIPNGQVVGGSIENLSAEAIRRIDMVFGIGYGDDIKKAKSLLEGIMQADERVLAEPAAQVAVGELADSSVNFVFRPWVKTADYWDVKFAMNEKVKETFDANGISIPFPQQDVHMHNVG